MSEITPSVIATSAARRRAGPVDDRAASDDDVCGHGTSSSLVAPLCPVQHGRPARSAGRAPSPSADAGPLLHADLASRPRSGTRSSPAARLICDAAPGLATVDARVRFGRPFGDERRLRLDAGGRVHGHARRSRSRSGRRPRLGPADVLLEVSHCGVCGSDLHFLLEWGGHAGAVEGHEYSGTVVAVGDEVNDWEVGDRVVGGPSPSAARCEYCLADRPSLCVERGRVGADEGEWQGAFAEYKAIAAASCCGSPTASLRSTRRWPSRSRSRCTASRVAVAPDPGRAGSSPAADRSASCRSRR